MKPEAIYNILFIDDDCDLYLPVLEPAAWEQGFTLYDARNVQEGLQLLNDYPDTLDAVLLDITFRTGELQGLEALRKIKKLSPFLPVIMLTGSDKASDLHKVVECMRNGAYDYIGKQELDPVQLFETVYEAIQKSKQQYRLVKNDAENKSEGLYAAFLSGNPGINSENAVFGFRLISINKPKNTDEEELMRDAAIRWHQNLLKSIHFAYKDNLTITLKLITNDNKFDMYVIFHLWDKDKSKLQETFENLEQDIHVFFITNQSDPVKPYYFEEIRDEKLLKETVFPVKSGNYTLFHTKPVKVSETTGIGFSFNKTIDPSKIPVQGQEFLLPPPVTFNFDNELLKALQNQKTKTVIDIQLKPRNLNIEENQLIRSVLQRPAILNSADTLSDLNSYTSYLDRFLTVDNNKFAVSILLHTSTSRSDNHLKTGIINYFFGGLNEVISDQRSADSLNRFSIKQDSNSSQLPFIFDQNSVLQPFHLPMPVLAHIPGIKRQSNVFHKTPDKISTDGITLGEKLSGNEHVKIKISQNDLARHLYIMGQTGTGKSTMLKTMIADCLKNNLPFALIDPHGDLFDEVKAMIPASHNSRTVLLDTTNPSKSAKHNPIGYDENYPQSKSLVINELIRIFSTLYDMRNAGGPMFELYLKNGLLLVMDEEVTRKYGKATLQNFVDIFFNQSYRKELMQECGNQKVIDFFEVAEDNSGDWSFSNFATYVTSKLTRFTEDYYLTPIITSRENNIDFRKLMDNGGIFLAKLDKGLVGADNVSLLGQMVVSSIVMAAMSRTNINKDQRKPYYLFIDEFQNFIKGDISSALSEVRKYGLSMILANQTLGQLQDGYNDVIQGLMGNVGSMVFFRPGINDYDKIKHFIEPDFEKQDALKLPNFNCIGRIMTDNVPGDPFVFSTIVNS